MSDDIPDDFLAQHQAAMLGSVPQPNANPMMGAYGNPFGSLSALYNNPDYQRQQAFDVLTNAGMALVNASAPGPYPKDFGQAFGALAGGAAQGAKEAQQNYMQRAMMGAQLRNLQMQSAMYPAALQQLQGGSNYDPNSGYGGGAQTQGQPPTAQASAPPPDSSQPNPNNIGNVRPVGSNTGFQQPADFNSGVKLAVNTARAYPALFNGGRDMTLLEIGKKWAPAGDGANDPSQWAKNVATVSGLPVDKPLDLNDPATATAFARGVHGAEWGGNAVRPAADYSSALSTPGGVQLAQVGDSQSGGASSTSIPRLVPPDPSKYPTWMPGIVGEMAKQRYQADVQKYNNAVKVLDLGMRARAQRTTEQNADVGPNGQPNEAKIAAEKAKKQGEMEATEAARTNTLYGGPGWEKKSPDELRKQANPELLSVAEGVQSGQIKMADIGTRQSPTGITFGKNDVQALGRALYKDQWDPNAGDRREKFMSDITDQDKQSGRTLYAVNTLYKHADQWQDLFLKIGNSESPAWNAVKKWLADNTGKSDYTTPEALSHAVGTELANAIKGQQLNMPEVEAAVETLKTTQSPKQGVDAINALMHAMQARESTLKFAARRAKVPESYIDGMIDPDAKQSFDHFTEVQKGFRTQNPGAQPPPSIPPPPNGFRIVQ